MQSMRSTLKKGWKGLLLRKTMNRAGVLGDANGILYYIPWSPTRQGHRSVLVKQEEFVTAPKEMGIELTELVRDRKRMARSIPPAWWPGDRGVDDGLCVYQKEEEFVRFETRNGSASVA